MKGAAGQAGAGDPAASILASLGQPDDVRHFLAWLLVSFSGHNSYRPGGERRAYQGSTNEQ